MHVALYAISQTFTLLVSVFVRAGFVSTWARTSEVINETGGEGGATGSFGPFGLDGKRPRLPFR